MNSTSEKPIRILIADDHALVRMGLATLLAAQPGFEVAGEAGNGERAVQLALRLKPDVVVMDLIMPKKNGAAATAELREKLPSARILILTSCSSADELKAALDAGAAGLILKSTANRRLVAAVRKTAAGITVIDEEIERLFSATEDRPELSPRQLQILEALARGLSNADIAKLLDIGAETVKTQIGRLFEKLGAANRTEAVALAMQKHLIAF